MQFPRLASVTAMSPYSIPFKESENPYGAPASDMTPGMASGKLLLQSLVLKV